MDDQVELAATANFTVFAPTQGVCCAGDAGLFIQVQARFRVAVQAYHCAAAGVRLQHLHKGLANAARCAYDQGAEPLGERSQVQRAGVGLGCRG